MSSLNISVAPEPILHIGKFAVTNSLLTTMILTSLLILLALSINIQSGSKKKSRFFIFFEMIVEGFYNFFKQIAGQKTAIFFPFLFTFFIFIILGNWLGLLPGFGSIGFWEELHGKKLLIPLFRGPTADLNTTIALGLTSVLIIQFFSIKYLGLKNYISKFINLRNPINFFVGVLEIISEVSKIISFAFRLFGNIFAGEVLLAVMTFIIPIVVPLPFLILEVFVGFIQALVFTMLSLIFVSIATEHH